MKILNGGWSAQLLSIPHAQVAETADSILNLMILVLGLAIGYVVFCNIFDKKNLVNGLVSQKTVRTFGALEKKHKNTKKHKTR